MMRSLVLLILCVFVTSCASQRKLTDHETQKIFAKNPDLQAKWIEEQKAEDRKKLYYQFRTCDSGKCSDIRCLSPSQPSCWVVKEETDFAYQVEKASLNPKTSAKMTIGTSVNLREECYSQSASISVRRKACFTFLENDKIMMMPMSRDEKRKAVRFLCDFDGVQCVSKGSTYGKGRITPSALQEAKSVKVRDGDLSYEIHALVAVDEGK